MKQLFTILSILFSIISSAQEQNWKYITTSENGTEYFFKSNNYDTAWTKEISEKIEYYPDNKIQNKKTINGQQITLYKFDCSKKKLGIMQITTYSKSGKALKTSKSTDDYPEMDYVIPDSIGESLINAFCNK